MNKTKKITLGAMLLALIGALLLIDRQLSYVFTYFIVLLIPVIISVYCCLYSLRDGFILCFGIIVLTILFGSLYSYMYLPVSMITGLFISYAIKKNYDRRLIMLISIAIFTIAELLISFLVSPLLGISIVDQLEVLKEEFNIILTSYGLNSQFSNLVNDTNFFLFIFIFSVILVGIMEGYLISFMTVFVLKRMKIKDIGYKDALSIRMPSYMAYILLLFTSYLLFMRIDFIANEIIKYSLICLGILSSLVLFYYGYLFIIIYMKKKYKKVNLLFLILAIFLLFPFSYIILLIFGFLYGSGPFRKILEHLDEKE